MNTKKSGTFSQFPRSIWAANTMEIFERMRWCGFYAVSSLYLTVSVEDGGLVTSIIVGVCVTIASFGLYLVGMSGWVVVSAIQHYGPHGINQPGEMWILFAALAGTTAVSLVIYNRWVTKSQSSRASG